MQSKCSCPVQKQLGPLVLFLALYSICFFWLDKPIALWAHSTLVNTWIFTMSVHIESIASTGHWIGLAIIAGILGLFFKIRHKAVAKNWLFFAISILVATTLCFILKTLLGRYRPIELFNAQLYGFHGFSRQYEMNSSPSGHVVAAMAGLLSFAMIFKKRWLTLLLMALVTIIALSRVAMTAHYLGDVIFGAYIGILSVWLTKAWLAKLFRM